VTNPSNKKKRKGVWLSSKVSAELGFSVASLLYYVTGTDVTGHATVAANVVSIEFRAQLLLVDSPLPTFFCFISCSVFVSDLSPPVVAYADVENIPVNAAAIKTVATVIALFIINK
jgi:hypothetical protein